MVRTALARRWALSFANHFDWVEIGAIGRQKDQQRAGRSDRPPHGGALVAGEIVHDDDVAAPQRRHQELDDPGQEADGIDRLVEDAGRDDPVASQAGHEGQRLPMAMRHLGDQPLAERAASMQSSHVRLGPGLVDKDQPLGINFALQPLSR